MKSIFDRTFKYTPSHQTDVAKTIARVRREQKAKEEAEAQHKIETASKVRQIKR